MIDDELVDYFHNYCETVIWLKKIILSATKQQICKKDIVAEIIAERNRLLALGLCRDKRGMKRKLNEVATIYYCKVAHWSKSQKIAVDMV